LKKVKELWESYKERAPFNPLICTSDVMTEDKPKEELDIYDEIAQNLGNPIRPASEDEFQDYCDKPRHKIGKMTALEWWCQDQQREHWPRLSFMALDILSIPAMSDEPEQVFSGACRTVSWDRAQISAETLEKIECLKHWKRNGILNEILIKE
jgi:hAT family protein